MQKLVFAENIHAPKEKVWSTLWNDSSYREWTSAFAAGSHAVSDWKEGSKILFLDGKGDGMVSKIETSKPNEFICFKHLGEVKNGKEDTESEAVKSWAGATENYTLKENGDDTLLTVEMDITDDFKDYFIGTFPKAIDLVKSLSENGVHKQTITPFLWFNNNLEEALDFYTAVFKDAKIINVRKQAENGPVFTATFEINGQKFMGLNGGPMFNFTPAVSFFISCKTQAEIDELWEKLSEGGRTDRCGWLTDKFGLSWQVVPEILGQLFESKEPGKADRVMQAMLKMTKLNIQELQNA
jgi:predicted 3-demethylubiquinone-9 3-methyltransferase (glyoxalase superfamily)